MLAIHSLLRSRTTLFGLLLLFASNLYASAPVEQVIHNFALSSDGTFPGNGLVADSAGNLYGATARGGVGATDYGVVFELSPPATAGNPWTETILYSFGNSLHDGQVPDGTLIFDSHGNLYGTTVAGGSGGDGTVFELRPPATAGGALTETILYSFPSSGNFGTRPPGKLALDPTGNLYGTTWYGGTGTNCGANPGCGTVYRLAPPATAGGAWTHTVLHNFGVSAVDGIWPAVAGVLYRGGALYGTTQGGGVNGEGTVFVLVPSGGVYIEHRLHDFAAVEGGGPSAGLVADSDNNLYGTTLFGGGSPNCGGGCGAIFELSPPAVAGGAWTETTLYSFTHGLDGSSPWASLYRDQSGSLYGTATQGGLKTRKMVNNGVVFRLKPPAVAGGTWTLVPLHEFQGPDGDGSNPYGELILVHGVFYGTTNQGGSSLNGSVFSVGP